MPGPGQMFQSMGFMGIVLLIAATAGVFLVLRRARELRVAALSPPDLRRAVAPLLAQGDVDRALDATAANRSFLAQLLQGALLLHGAGEDEMLANLERVAARETLQRGNRVAHLARLGVMTLLLGFLGTALGLIAALTMLRQIKAPTAADFAGAIGEALVCSAFGILVAALSFAGFYLLDHGLTRRTLAVVLEAEELLRPVLRPPSRG
jgi:biopolymer transport protein ExbB